MNLGKLMGIKSRKFDTDTEEREFAMATIERLGMMEAIKEEIEEKKLNLGCGNRKLVGFVNIDRSKIVEPDIVYDLEMGLPKDIPRNSVSSVYASHILEHIRNFIPLMEEIYEVCKDNAEVIIKAPHFKSKMAFDDPTHVRFFTENTFDYFSQEIRKKNNHLFDYNFKCDFEPQSVNIAPEGVMTIILKVRKEGENAKERG